MKKYELTGETLQIGQATLHRIKATKSFADVSAGETGGWVEKEKNLAQDDNAWVYDNAMVTGNAFVSDNAMVSDNAWVTGNACVYGDARVTGNAWVYGDAFVSDNAMVTGNACVYGDARVSGDACVSGDARVTGNARITNNAMASGNAFVSDNARVTGNARVSGDARVSGNARVTGNARITNNAMVTGNAWVYGDTHHLEIGPIGSRNDTITFTREKNGSIFAQVGCFFGTLAEFREKVGKTHGENEHAQAYLLAAELAELRIDTTPVADKQETPDEAESGCWLEWLKAPAENKGEKWKF